MAAGIAEASEVSQHASMKERVVHVQAQERTADLKAAREGSTAGSNAAAGLEETHWLCPIEDRRRLGSPREGMLEGFSLGNSRADDRAPRPAGLTCADGLFFMKPGHLG